MEKTSYATQKTYINHDVLDQTIIEWLWDQPRGTFYSNNDAINAIVHHFRVNRNQACKCDRYGPNWDLNE